MLDNIKNTTREAILSIRLNVTTNLDIDDSNIITQTICDMYRSNNGYGNVSIEYYETSMNGIKFKVADLATVVSNSEEVGLVQRIRLLDFGDYYALGEEDDIDFSAYYDVLRAFGEVVYTPKEDGYKIGELIKITDNTGRRSLRIN